MTSPTDRSTALVELGRAYLRAFPFPDFVASTTGGSVARGEADEYSDLDINIYVDASQTYSANREFGGETIQIHIHPFPSMEVVRESAWSFRFLKEAGIVTDPTGRYESFARKALSWLTSREGLSASVSGALSNVSERRSWAEQSILDCNGVEAGMASVAAMTDAAMLCRALRCGVMSTGSPLTDLDELDPTPAVDLPWKDFRLEEAGDLLKGLAGYRQLMAEGQAGGEDFILDSVQDLLIGRKVSRMLAQGNPLRLGETLYHDTFWIMRTRAKWPLAEHLSELPEAEVAAIRRIGFNESSPEIVCERLAWADQVCQAACV